MNQELKVWYSSIKKQQRKTGVGSGCVNQQLNLLYNLERGGREGGNQ